MKALTIISLIALTSISCPVFSSNNLTLTDTFYQEYRIKNDIINSKLKYNANFECSKSNKSYTINVRGHQHLKNQKRISKIEIGIQTEKRSFIDLLEELNFKLHKSKNIYQISITSNDLKYNTGTFISSGLDDHFISIENFRPLKNYPNYNDLYKIINTLILANDRNHFETILRCNFI